MKIKGLEVTSWREAERYNLQSEPMSRCHAEVSTQALLHSFEELVPITRYYTLTSKK